MLCKELSAYRLLSHRCFGRNRFLIVTILSYYYISWCESFALAEAEYHESHWAAGSFQDHTEEARGSWKICSLLFTSVYIIYMKSLHEVTSLTSEHRNIHTTAFSCAHLSWYTGQKPTFSLPGLLCPKPNLINWNYHFSGLSGFLYGLESSTHQLYHTSEQLPKCLNKSLLLLNCSKEKHQQIQTTSYILHSWNYYKSCLNLTRVYLVNHNIMSRTFSFLIYYSRHLILLHGSKWQKGGKQL